MMYEDWKHIILCLMIGLIQQEFVIKVHNVIKKIIESKEEYQTLLIMINDIIEYFKESNNYRTAQEVIGLKYLFWGFIYYN